MNLALIQNALNDALNNLPADSHDCRSMVKDALTELESANVLVPENSIEFELDWLNKSNGNGLHPEQLTNVVRVLLNRVHRLENK